MAKKEKIKELKYNIEGSDLENFLKVRDDTFLSIEQTKSAVEYYEKNLDKMKKEIAFWEEILKQSTNPSFLSMQDTAKEALEKGKPQVEKCEKGLLTYKVNFTNLNYLYNSRFTNLPIEDGVCVVDKDTIIYCNIQAPFVDDTNN